MRNLYRLIPSLLLLTTLCASAELLSTPTSVQAAAEKSLTKCTLSVAKQPTTGNQLVADGLTNCYNGARTIFSNNIERAAQQIEKSKDSNCHKLYSELEERWAIYTEEVNNLPSLGAAPLNTGDDLELILLAHKYSLAYSVANNSACRN